MSQTSLLGKIKNDAVAVVSQIEADSKQELESYVDVTNTLLQEAATLAQATLEKEKKHLETVVVSKSRQAANIAVQTAKRRGVNAVFEEAFSDVKNADKDEYISFFTAVAKKVLPHKATGTALAPASRVAETKEILKKLDIDADVIEAKQVSAGLILDTQDGAYDASLDRIFNELRPKLEIEIINQAL